MADQPPAPILRLNSVLARAVPRAGGITTRCSGWRESAVNHGAAHYDAQGYDEAKEGQS